MYTEVLYLIFQTRIITGIHDIIQILDLIFGEVVSYYQLLIWICFGLSVIVALLGFLADKMMTSLIENELKTLKSLILRVNPLTFVANFKVQHLIFGRSMVAHSAMESGSEVVFHTSPDGMMALDSDAVIQSVNPAATTMFGFTPEQMLGQNINLLIHSDVTTNTSLFYTLKLMKGGQSPLIFECDVSASREDESSMPLRIVLIGFAPNNRNADSFALICRDLSEERRDSEAVEQVKREADQLLHALIPQEMLSRIANREPNFTIPVASVLVMNISQFSEYISFVSAPELLRNLKKIFDSFDESLADFQSLRRLKILGDIYVVAAGLFCSDTEITPWTMDLLHFSVRCLEKMEELNVQLNSNLQLKIGLHTGGPLFIGVVGDKNNFTVIGGPVLCAQELERRAQPGTINMSASAYENVAPGTFQIEEHEDVVLGDFGQQMTYTVSFGNKMAPHGSRCPPDMLSKSGDRSGHGSAFPMPSLVMLMGSMPGGSVIGDHALLDPIDVYEAPPIDSLGAPH
jgi:guanylate cyclase